MTFRNRLLFVLLPAVFVPLVVLVLIIRQEVTDRLTAQFEAQVDALEQTLHDDLTAQSVTISNVLSQLTSAIVDDNRFRRGVVDGAPGARRYVIDYAENAMRLTGLAMLQIHDQDGRILSSGHFRNEFDRQDEVFLQRLVAIPDDTRGIVLASVRLPAGAFTALVQVDSFQMGGKRFFLVGGQPMDEPFLRRLVPTDAMQIALRLPSGMRYTSSEKEHNRAVAWQRDFLVPFITDQSDSEASATFSIEHDEAILRALLAQVNQWFFILGGVVLVLVGSGVMWASGYVSRPLAELAAKTERLDVGRLDVAIHMEREDEVGVLADAVKKLSRRLRSSVHRLKEAERRATTGELARQVNHDIKNGLIPIRNVLRHFKQVADASPTDLPDVFHQRERTLDASMGYLEDLAANYAQLSPRMQVQTCDVNAMLRQLAKDLQRPSGAPIRTQLASDATVLADPVALRRILENVINNALDSLTQPRAQVSVETHRFVDEYEQALVRIDIIDQGKGLCEEEQAHIFDDFYTTKSGGTGLGLSIVRRLLMDLGGTIRVESKIGQGSRFTIELPAHTSSKQ